MTKNVIRDRLSESSRVFFKRATEQLPGSPRHAVTDLCAGIELLMKARLAHEHWALVADKPGEVPLSKMEKGEFESVGFGKAIDRLEAVTSSGFCKSDKDLLKQLAQHRNKVIHFYHPELDTDDPKLLAGAAAEQCRAWLLVERLVTKDWEEAFKKDRFEWSTLRASFRKNGIYLNEKFASVKIDIAALERQNTAVVECEGCGFCSSVATERSHCIYTLKCLVCDALSTTVRVPCPQCGAVHVEEPEISPYCGTCDKDLWSAMGLESQATGFCGACYCRLPTVHAPLNGDEHVCACCLEPEEATKCENCGALWVGSNYDDSLPHYCQECFDEYTA